MSYGSSQEKRHEVTKICMFFVTRLNRDEWDLHKKPRDPHIILGKWVKQQTGIQQSDDIMGYSHNLLENLTPKIFNSHRHSHSHAAEVCPPQMSVQESDGNDMKIRALFKRKSRTDVSAGHKCTQGDPIR